MMKLSPRSLSTYCLAVLASCKQLPEIPITTPEPLEVNLNMRLDIYQYRGDEPADKEAEKTVAEAMTRQRNRMEEIQKLKNNRFVGEDHRGLLALREVPAGDWGDYVKRTVNNENDDRSLLMRNQAKEQNKALHEIQEMQWKLRMDRSFKGEWIETAGEKAGTYKWSQAEGPKTKDKEANPEAKGAKPATEEKPKEPAKPAGG